MLCLLFFSAFCITLYFLLMLLTRVGQLFVFCISHLSSDRGIICYLFICLLFLLIDKYHKDLRSFDGFDVSSFNCETEIVKYLYVLTNWIEWIIWIDLFCSIIICSVIQLTSNVGQLPTITSILQRSLCTEVSYIDSIMI